MKGFEFFDPFRATTGLLAPPGNLEYRRSPGLKRLRFVSDVAQQTSNRVGSYRLTSSGKLVPLSEDVMNSENRTRPYTVAEAADALSLSPFTIRLWLSQRRISCLKLGRAVRIPASEVERLLSDNLIPAKRKGGL